MKFSIEEIIELIKALPMWVLVLSIIFIFMAIVGQWVLYSKCNLPGYSCLVPIWNVIVFLRIVGRPKNQAWWVIIPPIFMITPFLLWNFDMISFTVACIVAVLFFLPWAYLMIMIYKEVCQCFGKYSTSSYILIVIFNGLYLFNLALSQEEKYLGPVYKN